MDAATRRRLIALKSPTQKQVDPRPRCQDCGRVLERSDFTSYWDGQDPRHWYVHGISAEEYRSAITPRCCEDCAEKE